MYFMVTYLGPLLRDAGVTFPLLLPVGAFLTSVGVYRLLTMALRWLMGKFECIRALVLGPSYVNGTWVGWFRGHTNEFRYMVEHFEQTLDSVVIRGWSYTNGKTFHGHWLSDSVVIGADDGHLRFTYKFNVHTQSQPLHGLNDSLFQRASPQHAPYAYSGLAHDLNDQKRISVNSLRVSNEILACEKALELAISKFQHLDG